MRTRLTSRDRMGLSEPVSSDSRNLAPAEKPMNPIASSVMSLASCMHSALLTMPTA